MPSYGAPNTATQHRPDTHLLELQKEVAALVLACDHHFTPDEGARSLRESLLSGVYSAGSVGEMDGKSEVEVIFSCTKCGTECSESISKHCPFCGKTPHGSWKELNDLGRYFGMSTEFAFGVWFISCECGFKAIGTRRDR